jgi:hypothetical protein
MDQQESLMNDYDLLLYARDSFCFFASRPAVEYVVRLRQGSPRKMSIYSEWF